MSRNPTNEVQHKLYVMHGAHGFFFWRLNSREGGGPLFFPFFIYLISKGERENTRSPRCRPPTTDTATTGSRTRASPQRRRGRGRAGRARAAEEKSSDDEFEEDFEEFDAGEGTKSPGCGQKDSGVQGAVAAVQAAVVGHRWELSRPTGSEAVGRVLNLTPVVARSGSMCIRMTSKWDSASAGGVRSEGRWEGRHVALKTLDPRVAGAARVHGRTSRHERALHPNVVELFAATRARQSSSLSWSFATLLYQLLHQTKETVDGGPGNAHGHRRAAGLVYLHAQDRPSSTETSKHELATDRDKTIKLCDFGLVTTKVTA